MKKKILFAVVLCVTTLSVVAQNDNRLFHLSLITPLGTNGIRSQLAINKVSVNLLGGYSYGNTVFELGGLYNANTQLTKGVQIAGILNYTGQSHNAVQFAGVVNISAKGVGGAQIGGVVNIADEAKAQISGVINVAKQVKGIQIGVVNYADSCDGVQIGLVNIVKKGGKREVEVSFSEALNTIVSFKLGTDKLYTIFSGGISCWRKTMEYAYGIGFGTHQNWGKRWGSQLEIMGYQLTEEGKFRGGLDLLTQLKFVVSKQIANHFKVFAGPVMNMTISDYVNPLTGEIGSSLAPYTMWEQTSGKTNLKAWTGWTVGVRF